MASRNVTSVDVARHAGVSQSAVSRFFTPGASVSAKMAAKIRAAADELGYSPNVLARSLITGKSRIVGLVVYYLENQFYPEVVEKLSVALQESGYHVLLFMASHTTGDVGPVMQRILDYQVDGIIMVSVSVSSVLAQRCAEMSIPVMLFNRDQPDLDLLAVTTDNLRGGMLAAQTLLEGAPRRIAHLAGYDGASTQVDREAGFLKKLRAEGHDLHARASGNFHYAEAVEAAHELFDRPDPPDALFVTDDNMAFAAMDVIRHEFRLRIPQDVAVVGFDDVPQASWPSFNLTTIRQHINQMVSKAVSELITVIEGESTDLPVKLQIPPTLIRRGTTHPA